MDIWRFNVKGVYTRHSAIPLSEVEAWFKTRCGKRFPDHKVSLKEPSTLHTAFYVFDCEKCFPVGAK